MTATQVIPYPDPHYAGAKLWWNMIFQYPAILGATILVLIGIIRACFRQPWSTRNDKIWNTATILVGLLPLAFLGLLVRTQIERQRKVDAIMSTYFNEHPTSNGVAEMSDSLDMAPSLVTRGILEGLKNGTLSTEPWSDIQVMYDVDSVLYGWQRRFRCTSNDTVGSFSLDFLYPESAKRSPAKRLVESKGRSFRMVTVPNDLFSPRDSMDINIIYSELYRKGDFLRPVGNAQYLLVISTPMNWTGRMVAEWRFVQLISFEEECVYELAIPA